MKHKIIFSLVAFIFMFSSCRKDDDPITTTGTVVDPPIIEVESSYYGVVMDQESRELLSGATLITETGTITSDNFGYFTIRPSALSQEGSLIKVEMPGYFDAFKFVMPSPGNSTYIEIQMVKEKVLGVLNTNETKTINISDPDTKITFQANSIADANGNAYSGDYEVLIHYYDSRETGYMESIPGDLRGTDKEGNPVQLESYGMMAVELRSLAGEELNLLDGATATWQVSLVSEVADLPLQIPLWSLDENTGIWIEDGMADLINGVYVGEVSHFSFWNCDWPYPLIEISGFIKDAAGQVVSDVFIEVKIVDGLGSGYGVTDNSGAFRGKVPADELLELTFFRDCFNLQTLEVGPFSEDTELDPIIIGLPDDQSVEYFGVFLNCDGTPVENGYVIVEDDFGLVDLIQVGEGGSFSGEIIVCNNSTITIQGVDENNLTQSEIFTYQLEPGMEPFELGEISACDSLEEYWEITSEDNEMYLYADVFSVISGQDLEVFVNTNGTDFYNHIILFNPVLGDNSPSVVEVDYPNSSGSFCSNVDCNNVVVNIISLPVAVNDFLEGTISGTLEFNDGSTKQLDIKFKTKLINYTNQIRGMMWLDENENGIRETNELPITDVGIFATSAGETYQGTVNSQGNYVISVPNGETIDIILQILAQYEMSPQDQGSDDTVDSDFNNVAQITNYTVNENVNFDAGFISNGNVPMNIEIIPQYCEGENGCIITEYEGNEFQQYVVAVSNQNTGFSYTSPEATGIQTICEMPAGTYEINVFFFGEVVYTDQITIIQEDINITVENFFIGCDDGIVRADIEVLINGGVYPFSPLWYDSDNNVVQSGPYLEATAGTYTFEASFNGCSNTETFVVPEALVTIVGRVWDDNSGGFESVFDELDGLLKDITIDLFDEFDNLLSTTITDENGQYTFENIASGSDPFYLKINSQSYTIVEKGVELNDYEASDADPSTGKTDLFDPANCGTYTYNFGLK